MRSLSFMAAFLVALFGAFPYALGQALSWQNDPLPPNSTDYAEGARWIYNRLNRGSPFNLEFEIMDTSDRSITHRDDVLLYLSQLFKELWMWNCSDWKMALDDLGPNATFDKDAAIARKGGAFWETTAQLAVERIFANPQSDAVMLFGPRCVDLTGAVLPRCSDEGIPDAAAVRVTTSIDGSRAPLMPTTRHISLAARRIANLSEAISASYVIEIPAGLPVGSSHRELLDFRPYIGKSGSERSPFLKVQATSNGIKYPDYNQLFVPFRHLLLQGEVTDPMLPQVGMRYINLDALRLAFSDLLTEMREPRTAADVATRMGPFIVDKYYYMFDELASGVPDYRAYITGAVAAGWLPVYDEINLTIYDEEHFAILV